MWGDGWLDEMKHYERQRDALARPLDERSGYLARRGLRLTERGEWWLTCLVGFALVAAGYVLILLWAAGGPQ